MAPAAIEGAALASWLAHAGLALRPEEAIAFLGAARVLLPAELGLEVTLQVGAAPTEAQRSALRELWLRTGALPPAPVPMLLHPLSPTVIGASWRRLREAWARFPRTEAE